MLALIIMILLNSLFSFSQVRLESIEAVQKILEEANLRIQPTGTGNIICMKRMVIDLEGFFFIHST